MCGRLCCNNQQQHSKLLAQSVFKVSTFRFNTCTKNRAPLPDCRINNVLIQFIPSCQDMRMQFVDVLDPPFSDNACSIILCLVMGIFMPQNRTVTKFFARDSIYTKRAYAIAIPSVCLPVCHTGGSVKNG